MTEDYNTYKRIHILGAPGSGKTTLARQLAAALAAPHYKSNIRRNDDKRQPLSDSLINLCEQHL
jgi:adenylate kinase family enzyme